MAIGLLPAANRPACARLADTSRIVVSTHATIVSTHLDQRSLPALPDHSETAFGATLAVPLNRVLSLIESPASARSGHGGVSHIVDCALGLCRASTTNRASSSRATGLRRKANAPLARASSSTTASGLPDIWITRGGLGSVRICSRSRIAFMRSAASATNAGNRSYRPSAQRYSIAIFWPSTYLRSCNPWRNAATSSDSRAADELPRYAIRYTFPVCCASASSGARARLKVKMTGSPISRMGTWYDVTSERCSQASWQFSSSQGGGYG